MVSTFLVVLFGIGLLLNFTSQKQPFIWFPSLFSWLKTLALLYPTWIGAVVIPSLYGCLCFLLLVLSAATQAPLWAIGFWAGLGSLFLVGSLFWYLLLVGLYSLVLRLLWSEVPQIFRWLELPKKKRDILFGWVASTVAVLVGVSPLVMLVLLSRDFTGVNVRYRPDLLNQLTAAKMEAIFDQVFIMWFVICAYLYQIRRVYDHAVAKRRKAKRLTT